MYITYKAMFPESAMSLLGYFVLADLVFVTLNDPSKWLKLLVKLCNSSLMGQRLEFSKRVDGCKVSWAAPGLGIPS